jgi:NAD(P)-dependent dehydrogenase (short-subunit alcohol dehydrogenase family)
VVAGVRDVDAGSDSHGDPGFGLAAPGGTAASYGISKAALIAFSSKLAAELADSPILVNAVCPGRTARTAITRDRRIAQTVTEAAAGRRANQWRQPKETT